MTRLLCRGRREIPTRILVPLIAAVAAIGLVPPAVAAQSRDSFHPSLAGQNQLAAVTYPVYGW